MATTAPGRGLPCRRNTSSSFLRCPAAGPVAASRRLSRPQMRTLKDSLQEAEMKRLMLLIRKTLAGQQVNAYWLPNPPKTYLPLAAR